LGRTAIISLAMTRSYRPCRATTMATRLPMGILRLPTGILRLPTDIRRLPTGILPPTTGIPRPPTGILRLRTGILRLPTGIMRLPTGTPRPTGILRLRTDIRCLPTGVLRPPTGILRPPTGILSTGIPILPTDILNLSTNIPRLGTGINRSAGPGAVGGDRKRVTPTEITADLRERPALIPHAEATANVLVVETPAGRPSSRPWPFAALRRPTRADEELASYFHAHARRWRRRRLPWSRKHVRRVPRAEGMEPRGGVQPMEPQAILRV
jgi:hypothetical protein